MRQFKQAQNDAKRAPKSMIYPPAQVFFCIVIMKKQSWYSKFLSLVAAVAKNTTKYTKKEITVVISLYTYISKKNLSYQLEK